MKITYRPEIDGLRAIAVGAVIMYHAQIPIFGRQLFKGGFIGVDIFFVISGYLITSIILKELVTTGSFSFKHFYERRIRRILPALLVVMLTSLIFAWIFLLPTSLIDYSKSIIYSLGFSSNIYFHYSGLQYGAENGLLIPFLHTWSLSVEEQYYILFPIILLLTFKFFKKYLIHTLIFGFIISLVLADWTSRNYSSLSFYFLQNRMWELLAGSILSYFEISLGHRSKNKKLNLVLPTAGLLLIAQSFLFYNDKMFHPSFYTLSPIIGVSLIIWFSSNDEIITKLLSTKFFVGVGLISYSLYLWHYPIFAFARITDFANENILKKIFLGIIILILSFITYVLFERPARNKNNRFKNIITIIGISIGFLIICNSIIISKEGFKNRLPKILSKNINQQPHWFLLKDSENKVCYINSELCKFNTTDNKKVYIIGDSTAATLIYNLKDRIVEKEYQFITSTRDSCMFFPGFNLTEVKTNKVDKNCQDSYFQKLKKILSNEKNSIIILAGRFPLYLSNNFFDNQEGGVEQAEEWQYTYKSLGKYNNIQNSFKNEVLKLSKNNKIILVYPIPEVGWDPNKEIFNQWLRRNNKFSRGFEIKENVTTSYDVYKNRAQLSFAMLDSITGNNIFRVYPHQIFCDNVIDNRCVTHDNENIFYADDDHPSLKGAEKINDLIIKKIEAIGLNSN